MCRVRLHAVFGGIGAFAVRFRWLVIAAWLVAALAVPALLPSLASVTQGDNSAFLPPSAPSQHAAGLAAPFGPAGLIPVTVITAGPSDRRWVTGLEHRLRSVPTVVKVNDLGRSADGQAGQLQVLSSVNGGDQGGLTSLVDSLRQAISRAGPPAGLRVHLAGDVAIQVDQQEQSGDTGSQVQGVSLIFILILLVLIFRALLAPVLTVLPALLAVAISGPLVAEAAHAGPSSHLFT